MATMQGKLSANRRCVSVGGGFTALPDVNSKTRLISNMKAAGSGWPTGSRDDTVQHVLHSGDLDAKLTFDFDLKYDETRKCGLSDHPFVEVALTRH